MYNSFYIKIFIVINPRPPYIQAMTAETGIKSLKSKYGGLAAKELIAVFASGEFAGKVFVTSSCGSESAVLLELVAEVDSSLPVVFLDTQKLFAETLAYAAALEKRLGLDNLITLKPAAADVAAKDERGDLWQRDPDACCHIRKVLPLRKFLDSGDWRVWINGRKRFHGDLRSGLSKIEQVGRMIKVNPLADWTPEQVADAFSRHDLPPHPLAAKGYLSIGCRNCTHKVAVGEKAVRAGRWAHKPQKTECGIHENRRRGDEPPR